MILAFRLEFDAVEAADPRTLPQFDLPRPQRLWHPGGEPRLFRQGRRRPDPARSRLSRGAAQGAVELRSAARHRKRRPPGATMCCARWPPTATSPRRSAPKRRPLPLGTIRYGSNEKFRQMGGYFMEEVRRDLISRFGEKAEHGPEQRLCRRVVGAHLDGPADAGCRRRRASRRPCQVRRRARLAGHRS